LSKHTVFIAGSPAFVEACQTAARSQGAPAEQIHSEGFFAQQQRLQPDPPPVAVF
jgi:CDP-4-dehydro-6-deoxyglucose reductase